MKKNTKRLLLSNQTKLKLKLKVTVFLCCISILSMKAEGYSENLNFETVALQQSIKGSVKDINGDPLPGASILEKGTTNGVVSDFDGKFSISLTTSKAILVVSYLGYVPQEISVANQDEVIIVLQENVSNLDEVVVVGYGTVKRKDLTGSVARADIEAFQNQPNVSVVQSLQGTVPGLNVGAVTSPGGNPGLSVRGRTSLSGASNPLIILDGIIYRGSLVDINNADVKSVDVLKDASSKAIYGSQAANGVVIITTKAGREERKPVFNFSSYLSVQTPSRMINPSTREGYINKTRNYYWEEAFLAPDYTERDPSFDPTTRFVYPEVREGFNNGTNTDWLDLTTQNSYIQNTNISMAGSTKKSSYYLSAGYTENKGYMKNDNFSKVNLRVNFENKIADGWNIGLQTFMSSSDYSGVSTDLWGAHLLAPLVAPYNDDGTLNLWPQGAVRNPLANLEIDDLDKRLNLFATFFTEIQIPFVKGLSYRLNYSTNYRTRRNYRFDKFGNTEQGSAYKNNSLNTDETIDNILTYSRTFNNKHDVKVTLLYGKESRSGDNTNANSGIFINQALGYNSLESGATDQQLVSSGAFQEDALYQMGRLNYGYDDRYLATLTFRRDGFSGFGVNNKFGTFPSIALAWVPSNEKFMADALPWVNNLKFRGSYGKSGNRTVGRYQTLARVSGRFLYVFGDGGDSAYGQYISALANNDLGWETTTGLNVGMDFSVLNNRLSGSIDYYNNTTEDILFNVNLPRITGFSTLPTNIGEVANNGLEISLSSTNIKTDDFEWRSTVAFSRNKNKIVSILGRDDDGDGVEDDLIANGLFIGEAIGAIYNYTVDGIYQVGDNIPSGYRAGQYILRDFNGDDLITPLEDRSIIGYTEPAYRFSIYNEFSYKNWTASAFINSIQGGKSGYYASNTPVWGSNNSDNWNMPREYSYWTPSNPNAEYSGLRYNNPINSPIYRQRSFVRLQDVNITYNLPANLVKNLAIDAARVYISGKNLATWTNWVGGDPETASGVTSYSLPVMKSFSLGLNLTF
ncbi:TonB-dependent receptor [Sabulilitoribacter arenilitoris]|uniref:TonB-dependent receptor n=1 Tax=Wocania arenilitoris TaxID=2044858 RepID=A0AAE3EQ38_9FLAO|nr:TonB-dependent receptor [Wocania arenilitoris]MCF7569593.1 TonB-dependent receptor [Wocania arenilitoris]